MSYDVIATPHFKREIKKLAKKYPSLKENFARLVENLQQEPQQGIPLGNNCYKIRLAITSKGKGKSGGARVITYLKLADNTIYLLSIYDKSGQESISDSDLKELLKDL